MKSYKETLDFLYSQLPMFQRIGPAAYKTDLTNTSQICERLGNPQDGIRFVHIAGTNGKGSVSHFLAAILQASGYRTGLYTSPHLKDFRERIRINGKMISEQEVTDFVDKNRDRLYDIHPSFFEYTFGMALEHFRKNEVDIAVLETGMGGRLDSTNIVKPLLSVITNIGMDHTAFLGDTMEKIAKEKAGIIKAGIPVVIGKRQEKVSGVFREAALRAGSPVVFADLHYKLLRTGKMTKDGLLDVEFEVAPSGEKIKLLSGLPGKYQAENLVTVLESCRMLNEMGFSISQKNIETGIKEVQSLTGIRGRWQVLGKSPLVICDIGHNEDGIKAVLEQLKTIEYNKLHIVFGTVGDKDPSNILRLLPGDAAYYFCRAKIPRAMNENTLKEHATQAGLKGEAYGSVGKAYEDALKNASDNDLVLIGGSTFVVAEVLQD